MCLIVYHVYLGLFEHARLIGRDHVFDVDEGIWAAPFLQNFQGLLNQVAHVLVEPLMVVDPVAHVDCNV